MQTMDVLLEEEFQFQEPTIQLTPEEQALASIRSTSEEYSKVVSILAEFKCYITHVRNEIQRATTEGNIASALVRGFITTLVVTH